MSITLDAITLPEDMNWTDEYDWSPVSQGTQYTLTGSLIVEEATKAKGRPITIGSDDAWATKADLDALRAKLVADTDMTLTLHDGRTFTVRWRHADTPIAAKQVAAYADPASTDYYRITLRFLEV